MLKTRVLFGAIMIGIVVGLVAVDDYLSRTNPAWYGKITWTVLGLLLPFAIREFLILLRAAGNDPSPLAAGIGCVLFWAGPMAAAPVVAGATYHFDIDAKAAGFALVVTLLLACLVLFRRRSTAGAINTLASTLFVVVYLGILPSFLMRIRLAPPGFGAWLLLYVILTIKVCDIGAYLTGRKLGRKKLIEWLSPKKTVEGFAGGIAASMIVAVVGTLAARSFGSADLRRIFPDWKTALIFGFLAAVIGQTGDLLESLFKREAAVKDSGSLVPEFGGALDVLDSLLLTAPVAFWLLT